MENVKIACIECTFTKLETLGVLYGKIFQNFDFLGNNFVLDNKNGLKNSFNVFRLYFDELDNTFESIFLLCELYLLIEHGKKLIGATLVVPSCNINYKYLACSINQVFYLNKANKASIFFKMTCVCSVGFISTRMQRPTSVSESCWCRVFCEVNCRVERSFVLLYRIQCSILIDLNLYVHNFLKIVLKTCAYYTISLPL